MRSWDRNRIPKGPQTRSGFPTCLVLLAVFGLAHGPGNAIGDITSLQFDPPAPTCVQDIYVSVSGYFADSCWSLDRIELLESSSSFQLMVYGVDSWDGTFGCAQWPVPYSGTRCMGPLSSGDYVVRAEENLTSMRPAFPDSQEIVVTVQCCSPTPGSVPDLEVSLSSGGSALQITWSDVSDADDYVLYQDTSAGGCFQEVVATAPTGQNVLAVPLPSATRYYVLVSRNAACGEGLKR